ncbi:hypothetical protein NNC19_08780 [Clostridium sp. SHJSY1]|uniref:hypothetical protein n=1 Tax=Clostridium sp. SHJSY1 TaxID=2942483 RepID=UPI002876153E|nr:hypothetical protein [Clostridium sp. SHJSY1]MDS0525771.1 hypothetical protein [Clostridium sp. SHJSY1]
MRVINFGGGFLNNFSGEQDGTGLMLSIGGGILIAGIALTPIIWRTLLYFVDMITMFFSG